MIIDFEDKDLEESVLNGIADIAVPLEIINTCGDTKILTYIAVKDIAEKYAELFSENPICAEGIEWLVSNLSPIMKKFGYYPAKISGEWINEYVLNESDMPAVFSNEVIIVSDPEKNNIDFNKFDISFEYGNSLCAVKAINDVAVSVAYVNDTLYSDGSVEIGVETTEAYRGKGFAAECAGELCRHLFSSGISSKVFYRTFSSNTASNKVAEKAGMRLSGRIYDFVCYKIGSESGEG